MKNYLIAMLLLPPISLSASESDPGPYQAATASYRIYGGSLGDPTAPSPSDRKIAVSIEGDAARKVFDMIGPDQSNACVEGTKMRLRSRDRENLSCTRSGEGEYVCSFGFDLRNGKSIGGSIC